MTPLDWSAPWKAPDHLARELWAIEAGAELLYLAEGQWVLVSRPERWTLADGGRRRRLTGWNILEQQRTNPNPVSRRVAQLLLEGCAVLWQGTFDHAPDRSIVEWFREVEWKGRHGYVDAAIDAANMEADGSAQQVRAAQTLEQWKDTEARSIFRYAQGRRSVLQH